jgi:hypothetical protein
VRTGGVAVWPRYAFDATEGAWPYRKRK